MKQGKKDYKAYGQPNIITEFRDRNCKDGCFYCIIYHPRRKGVRYVEPFCGYGPKMKLSEDKLTCLTKTKKGTEHLRRGC